MTPDVFLLISELRKQGQAAHGILNVIFETLPIDQMDQVVTDLHQVLVGFVF